MGNIAVQKKVLGSWPSVPETKAAAHLRYEAVIREALDMAAGRNVLLVSHAEVRQVWRGGGAMSWLTHRQTFPCCTINLSVQWNILLCD